jgi:Ca-activated chloride channel family protein
MSFEHPLALLLLPLAMLPLLGLRARRRLRLALPSLPPAPRRARTLWLPPALVALAVLLSALAAAGPHRAARVARDLGLARDLALALDTSESMRALDMGLEGRPASRMEAALRFADAFIAGREGDRVAIVAFGTRAVTQCPLTFDRQVARALLGYVRAEMLGKRTALGEGIALGTARLERGGALVLVSDGRSTAGEVTPAEAAAAAALRGVRVHAVGVGAEGPAPVPARMPSGRVRIVRKDYRLDEETLRTMAERTGGRYLRAPDVEALRRVFAEIDRLERREAEGIRRVPVGRLGHYLALAAAGALAAALALSATVLRTAPALG